MKISQPANRLHLAAALAVAAGTLTGAIWTSQPVIVEAAKLQRLDAVIEHAIPSITITAKRLGDAEKARITHDEIDPTLSHLTVVGYRTPRLASLLQAR